MTNKLKSIAHRGMSLVLAFSMMMPTGVYAGTQPVDSWDEYKEELKGAIVNQQNQINIDFRQTEIFTTEETAQKRLNNLYSDVLYKVPKQYGHLNIKEYQKIPKIVKVSSNAYRLESVQFEIDYYNYFNLIKSNIKSKIDAIKNQDTAYEKIKEAYDYIIENFTYESGSTNHSILEGLGNKEPLSSNAYAVLFSIMMDELGFENEVVVGTIKTIPESHVWNLVKVYGKWYHVDSRLGEVVYNNPDERYKYFLTSDEIMRNNYSHQWDIDKKADEIFDRNYETIYEIKFIQSSIDESITELTEIKNALTDITLLEELKSIEMEFNNIKEEIVGYKNSVEVLSNFKDIYGALFTKLVGDLDNLIFNEKELEKLILEKAAAILVDTAEMSMLRDDLNTAKQAVATLEYSSVKFNLDIRLSILEDKIIDLEVAIGAVEKAEKTRTQADVDIANTLITKLDEVETKSSLLNRIAVVQAEIDAKAAELNWIIGLVNDAETIIKTILNKEWPLEEEWTLENLTIVAEAAVKKAETEVKKIKDVVIRTFQQNRIKDIKLVIAAIKAVDKAERTVPQKSTYVNSARTAINKIVNYDDIKDELFGRIEIVDADIKALDAEKLVEKAENSLRRADYDKAKIAVEQIDTNEGKGLELKNRVADIIDVILAKEAVENAEKLIKANKSDVKEYETLVENASNLYEVANSRYNDQVNEKQKYNSKYGDILGNLVIRLVELQDAIEATRKVNDAEKSYQDYLNPNVSMTEEELINVIIGAELAVTNINDNNSNLKALKKSLQGRLKVITDRLNAEKDYNEVNLLLSVLEENLIDRLNDSDPEDTLYNVIAALEKEVAFIVEKSQIIKVSSQSKDIKDRTTAINNVIEATKAVVVAEKSDEKSASKNITNATKAVDKLSTTGIYKNIPGIDGYIKGLKNRIKTKQIEIETLVNEGKATSLVEKAISSKKEADIKAAIEAVAKLNNSDTKNDLNVEIENKIIKQLIIDANNAITKTLLSIERKIDNKSVSKNVADANKAVLLVENILLFTDFKLQTIDNGSYIAKYGNDMGLLNESMKVIYDSVEALKAVEQAEKTKKQDDVNLATSAIEKIPGDLYNPVEKYENMKKALIDRVKNIQDYLNDEADIEKEALDAVTAAEDEIFLDNETIVVNSEYYELILNAQSAVNKVNNKIKKAELQKRIDSMKAVIAAKSATEMAEAYTDAASVKAAEKALANLVKYDSYLEIVKILSNRIGELNKKLSISKKVDEATSLVQKAVDSRKSSDSIKARFAVEGIKALVDDPDSDNDPYDQLKKILDDLDKSIENASEVETDALKKAQDAIAKTFEVINDVNRFIAGIIEGEDQEREKIKEAYQKIESAKIEVISANAAIRKLTEQKELLSQVDYANKEIELAEDNIDVKEAVRLVTIASSSVMNASDEEMKAKARLDIAAARRAIDKIGHSNNKAIKTTILNTINAIEKKLTQDNDQELIDSAVKAVNDAAEMVTNAVRNNNIMEKQVEIDKAIFSAKLAIGWISDNNKAAKTTLTGFINDIEAMYKAEIEGIKNEEKIQLAERAVKEAEDNKESDNLESLIRTARFRISVIVNDGPDTKAKIDELNARLDALEGKNGGNPGSGGNSGGGNNSGGSGGNKPGGGGSSSGNIIPTTPLPHKDRENNTAEPKWGDTKELKKANPTTGFSVPDMTAYKINDSKLKILELSKVLKNSSNTNAILVIRGKNISLPKPYILDKVNSSILVPIKSIGDEFGYSVSLIDNPVSKGAKRLLINGIVNSERKSIIMDIGSEYSYVNGYMVKVSSKPVIQDGRTYIPLDFIVEHLGLTFSYYNESGSTQLIIN